MAYVVLRPIKDASVSVPSPFGQLTTTVKEMQWVGVCPVVITYEEALSLAKDKSQIIEIEIT